MNDPLDADMSDRERAIMEEAYTRHSASMDVPFAIYRRGKVRELEGIVSVRKTAYLDTLYWIWLLDPSKSPFPVEIARLRELLEQGVHAGRLLCPFSYSNFGELMKIGDDARRMALARLMDALSCGIALKNPFDTAGIEYCRFIANSHAIFQGVAHTVETVWCHVGEFLGERYPYSEGAIPPEFENHLHKVMYDAVAGIRVEDLAEMPWEARKGGIADQINAARKQSPRGAKTFQEMFREEFHDVLDVQKDSVEKAMKAVFSLVVKADGLDQPLGYENVRPMINIMREVIVQKKDMTVLPLQRMMGALHAALRMDDKRPYKENDGEDIRHAANATAYCHAFFTERSLASLVATKEVREFVPYICQVAAAPSDAVRIIEGMLAS